MRFSVTLNVPETVLTTFATEIPKWGIMILTIMAALK